MVSQLKAYLHDVDFEETAQRIAEAVNTASPDCTKERLELADIDKKISNGVKAVITIRNKWQALLYVAFAACWHLQ